MTRGPKKEIASLGPADFVKFGVWEFTRGPDGDETWVKPMRGTPVSTLEGRLVADQVTLANGEARWALMGNVKLDNPKLTKHFLTLSVQDSGRWFHLARYHDPDHAERGPQALASFLGLPLDAVFPIAYDFSAKVDVDSPVAKGKIQVEPDERLSRAEVIALAVSGGDPTNEETGGLGERLRGLESAFGKADDEHLHGVVPFILGLDVGGTPDVVTFSDFKNQGKLYVTCELVGTDEQKPNSGGQYELAVCQREGEDWALDLILKLAFYTLETPLEHGETMDIGPATPKRSDIVAVLFKRIATYTAFGKPANVICCIGITKSELKYCMAHGSESLLAKMPTDYVLIESRRRSFV